ncbi:MAG: GTP cyclohydrolase-2 [Candidatus Thorarchaeota archaeon AB_25]|nr:MAG: GTP cyclohydrolase-2 [Candidatus Thorarchaeota archaeon AB_25]
MKLSKDQIDLLLIASEKQVCVTDECCVQLVAVANLPSRFGEFQIAGFVSPCDGKEHTAIIRGNIVGKEGVVTRVHSECLTGDVMGSQRCDCRDQLLESLKIIEKEEEGVLLYLRQEGRNIGLTEKIRAYALQDLGLDTIDANIHLGYKPDERDYGIAANILNNLQVKSIKLLTNNPEKIRQLTEAGITIVERLPLIIEPTEYSRAYIETKAKRSGHLYGELAETRDIDDIQSRNPENLG